MNNRYDYLQREQEINDFWQQQGVYNFQQAGEQPTFVVDTPPPTVSGKLHIGHVFSYTHADLIARYQRMCGKNVLYPMGFDDNGLPTERFVAKKRNLNLGQLSRAEFVQACLEECGLAEKDFKKLWSSLGLSVDWNTVYSTISPKVARIAQYSFIDLYKKGLLQRKADPFLYCTTCRTSIAQAELEWQEKSGIFNTVKFTDEQGKDLLIATTRPELIPACVAMVCHPDDARYAGLVGSYATVPLFGQRVKIIADSAIDPEKGTGIVMCCTFGDQMDVAWYKKYGLDYIQAIDNNGLMTEACGFLSGLKVDAARAAILERLKQEGLLIEQKNIMHGANVHERCGKGFEFQIIKQWFVKIVENKQKFLDIAERIEWHPEYMHSRYKDWVSNLSWDWCISRQRLFGIPMPAWNCSKCDYTLVAELKDLPVDPGVVAPAVEICPQCGGQLLADTDVMDTWATSALTPLIIAGWPDNFDKRLFPSSMRPQAHDIIRTWTFYTIVKSWYHEGSIPWQKIVISGHVLAGKEKISKSKENASNSPEKLIQNYSADAVRFWAASARLGMDTLFDEAKLKNGLRTCTKLWNAMRFVQQHLTLQTAPKHPRELDNLSEWLLWHCANTLKRYHQHFAENDFAAALEQAEKFFWQLFCDNYLEIVKDLLFKPEKYSDTEKAGAQYCLYAVGLSILQMYAPFMPFVTEAIFFEIFAAFALQKSLHLTIFNLDENIPWANDNGNTWNLLVEVVAAVRKLKSENNVSLKTPVSQLNVVCEYDIDLLSLQTQLLLLAGVTQAQKIEFIHGNLHADNAVIEGEAMVASVALQKNLIDRGAHGTSSE